MCWLAWCYSFLLTYLPFYRFDVDLPVEEDSSIASAVQESSLYFRKSCTPPHCSYQPLTASSHPEQQPDAQCTGTASGTLALSVGGSTSGGNSPGVQGKNGDSEALTEIS